MLKPMRKQTTQIADGRSFAARIIVLSALSAIDCYVFRRYIDPITTDQTRNEYVYPGAKFIADEDQHATRYEEQGYARLIFDRYSAGSMINDDSDVLMSEPMLYAQAEPFDIENYGDIGAMARNRPDWRPEKGDVFALIIDQDTIKWLECIGSTGQTLGGSSQGEKYAFNTRDSLKHLEPFKSLLNIYEPISNPYPLLLSEIIYTAAPLLENQANDPADLTDDFFTSSKFKLLNANDPNFANQSAVASLFVMQQATNQQFVIAPSDAQHITVDLVASDQYSMQSDMPIAALSVGSVKNTYLLVAIDYNDLVLKIKAENANNLAVPIYRDGLKIFDILPVHFDDVHQIFVVIVSAVIAQMNNYELRFSNDEAHSFKVDMSEIEAI